MSEPSVPLAPPDELLELEVRRIAADPAQPRLRFDEREIDELAAAIRAHSLLQPIVVTPNHLPGVEADFLVLFGERRLRAAIRAGRESLTVLVRRELLDPAQRILLQIDENELRAPLSLSERALAYRRAVDLSGLTPAEFARRHRLPQARLSKYLALAAADGFLGEALAEHRVHHVEAARAYLRLPARYQQQLLANARRTGDPITLARVRRAAAAADAEAEAVQRIAEGRAARASGWPEPGPAVAGDPPGKAAPARGSGSPGELPDGVPDTDPPVRLDLSYSALCRLLRRLGARPDASPHRAGDQLLELLARDLV